MVEEIFSLIVGYFGDRISNLTGAELVIFEISVILILSTVFAFIARSLKQPLIPAYVFAGLFVGPVVFGIVKNQELIKVFSEIGIAFLLFSAGLELSFRKIKEANIKKILFIGLIKTILIVIFALVVGNLVGLSDETSLLIGIILIFGSTMIDVKLLSDKNELVTLHGRIILGILLLEDLVAIFAIIIYTTGTLDLVPILISLAKLGLLILIAFTLNIIFLKRMFRFASRSTELLFLSSLGVLFLFVIFSYFLDVSVVISSFIAGVSLANSLFKTELESRIIPLRDFFAILFFVSLGMQLSFNGISENIALMIFLVAGAIILKPLILFILMRFSGYHPRISFISSISLGQLSEFSLVIGIIALSTGVINNEILSTIIFSTIVTMSLTPYLINYKENIYHFFKKPLNSLKFLPVKEKIGYDHSGDKEILLIGAHRMGSVILKELMKRKEKLIVIDFNPEIINGLVKKKVSCVYGEVYSPGLIDKINVKKLKLVISTVPNLKDNIHLLNLIKKKNKRIKVICTGARISEALKLYDAGADYVIMPKVIAGQKIANIIHSKKMDFKKARNHHLKILESLHRLIY